MHEAFVVVDSNCTIHFCSKGFLNLNRSLDSTLTADNSLTLLNASNADALSLLIVLEGAKRIFKN
jgi:hypothetical protein